MDETRGRITKDGIRIYEDADFAGMHAAGKVAAEILDLVGPLVVPGVTTYALDKFITDEVERRGVTSATIGYRGYEHASCISVNHVVCHGIPGSKIPKRSNDVIREGDILNIDVTIILDGWYGDTSRMYVAGKPKPFAKRLMQVTHDSLMLGIEAVKPGNTFGDIGYAIQSYVEKQGLSVVRDFCGHGIGRVFHAPPNVVHYAGFRKDAQGNKISALRRNVQDRTAVLEQGMFFTIEPMVNLGRAETEVLADEWTAVTRDGKLSAQYEHSIGVTATGAEIFTLSPGDVYKSALEG
ncbi:type I methionyl aminopeptidase [Pseudorhodobacter turbinis]|uniref:Methionine aminopeptidase n=1 Tax=Pseudorhodobacter turbinis TaxID=2500533 RepID=A0A4P8EH21_9RHOB|nr:type I methionyl aminopeptidase [Pseudorhodobacter turbinis]QCO56218.1 type I methionyl aminopeptidase [Pseudorhodobacter turbinis]